MQIQLTEEQKNRLDVLVAEGGVSLSALVREGVELCLQRAERRRNRGRAWKVFGSAHEQDAATDVAERHDDLLNRIYGSS